MRSSKVIALSIAAIGFLWIASGFVTGTDKPAPEPSVPEQQAEKKIPDVRVRQSKAESFPDLVIVTGRSQASRSVSLRAETNGQIQEILQEEGAMIEEGDGLARIETRDRQANYEEARQRAAQRQIQYDAAKKLQDKGFGSRVRLAEALADLEDARAVLKTAQVDLEKTTIKAPFTGILASQDIEGGDYVSSGDALFTIVDLDPIEFAGYVSEQNVRNLKSGQKAQVETLDGQTLEGAVTFIAPAADAQTRTFRVIVSAENADMAMKEGLTTRLKIPVAEKQAHKISSSILSLDDAGVIGVKIVDDENTVRFIPVQILSDQPEGMYISGPPEHARIITVGQDFVTEGQTVNPVESQGDGLL